MQNRNSLLVAIALALATGMVPAATQAQTTYLPLWSKEMWLLDRLEIKARDDNDLNLSTVKPYMRRTYVAVADSFAGLLRRGLNPAGLTPVDKYNLTRLQANSSEFCRYAADSLPERFSRKALGPFYTTRANMLEVDKKGFYLALNPSLQFQQGRESNSTEDPFLYSYGASGRGLIGKHLAFQFLVTGNQENGPLPFRSFVEQHKAIPGAGFYDSAGNGKGYRYTDARGSISTRVTKYINIQLGYDQQFIGNGYRSLMLSNFSGSHLFLKLNTRIWKLNYTNLFMQLSPTASSSLNGLYNKKYASMHHLGINATKWLNIGFFESIIFGRDDHFDYSYLQPVIFLRSIEQQNGSPDNANVGIDLKANIGRRAQLYGQLMLDEFLKDEALSGDRYWWGNKQGYQLGGKYVDLFGIRNLDLQAEFNQVRPFMYQFRDTTGSYAHYSQPLAHPMGGNLREYVGILRYQPLSRLYIMARVNLWKQGLDSAGYNFGANPNELYTSVSQGGTRLRDDNYPMFSGMPATGLNAAITASYELKENLFVEMHAMYRQYEETGKERANTQMVTLGFRWNMFRKEYDY